MNKTSEIILFLLTSFHIHVLTFDGKSHNYIYIVYNVHKRLNIRIIIFYKSLFEKAMHIENCFLLVQHKFKKCLGIFFQGNFLYLKYLYII